MSEINVVIADDEESTHEGLRGILSEFDLKCNIVKEFYDTQRLVRFLKKEEADFVDVLILDHDFGGICMNGMEVVPKIREFRPHLPILILSTYRPEEIFENFTNDYKVDYVNKPVKSADLLFRINNVIRSMKDWEKFCGEIIENKELIDYLMEENSKLDSEIVSMKSEQTDAYKKILPMEMQTLIQNIFPDVEFSPKSFRLLVKYKSGQADWNRMFRCLKMIDWKNENEATGGFRVQKYKEAESFGLSNVWEYRFSQKGRIFAQRRENQKPFILLIDPEHKYSDLKSF